MRFVIVLGGVVLRVDPDPNLPEFCVFLFFAEFYFLAVLIFWIKSSEFCWFLFFAEFYFLTLLIFWIKSSEFCWFLFFEHWYCFFLMFLFFGIPKFSRHRRSKINVNPL